MVNPSGMTALNVEHFSPKMPALPGSLQTRYVRCGKATCRCARGALHGPYLRRFWREDGRTRAQYVRLADVEPTRQALAAWRAAHPSLRSLVRELQAMAQIFEETTDGP